MATLTRLSYGGTTAIVTGMGLIVVLDGAPVDPQTVSLADDGGVGVAAVTHASAVRSMDSEAPSRDDVHREKAP